MELRTLRSNRVKFCSDLLHPSSNFMSEEKFLHAIATGFAVFVLQFREFCSTLVQDVINLIRKIFELDQPVLYGSALKLLHLGIFEHGLNGAYEEESKDPIDLSIFSGNLRRDTRDKGRDCWTLSDGNNFRVRSKHFCKHLMDLVAVDWFKDTKRMDHVVRRSGCAAQVAADKGLFSIVFNLQWFVDGDDEFRNSRLKLIPSVPKGSWIVRQSVGSTPCLLGKAVDCNYIRGPTYLEVDVDIGSSTVANGVLGLVVGVITSLVVDMAFLVQVFKILNRCICLIYNLQQTNIRLHNG
ncbi:hypothetical protein MIMGU_mgv1a010999mg [Erythranthe guttata]|uniref:Protein ENHANCED DISEASE RESISTANCE 2 C-terminal domain-containing protein n=1 Tax=Erythranthe guttata TaxID=4155 RepID=A0A022QCQ5_ERYGU|nr:hypothetical protein MIMGU_mgv1a010999mg [Erythranthe guttata]